MTRGGSVYILTNKKKSVLYIGVTSNLFARMSDHLEKTNARSFASRYNLNMIIYYEHFRHIEEAIEREKELKKWRREKKEILINKFNPKWNNLISDISEC
ncbi:GIY-YIG nuclease family protein [Mangrovivirga sp. M17]|uniref:GIY-YIG nuclease family protein n=1 Tax=Mangrovivirga halotolerans TaxID=2993936 RepID=A0ABT3RMJ0_9BACT|nr:GIY-YIG nuclease family protein [Mangrovivirga halotolerans]MCX2742671.1 GIY-YIG nuclease family protein [Mangrovivirga halotolerans]